MVQQKDPPDPLAGVPEQPPVADESGFKRTHDREFERGWHVVALQRDMTEEDAEFEFERRQKVQCAFHLSVPYLYCTRRPSVDLSR